MSKVTEPVEVFPYSQRRRATQRITLRYFVPLRETFNLNSSEGTTDFATFPTRKDAEQRRELLCDTLHLCERLDLAGGEARRILRFWFSYLITTFSVNVSPFLNLILTK